MWSTTVLGECPDKCGSCEVFWASVYDYWGAMNNPTFVFQIYFYRVKIDQMFMRCWNVLEAVCSPNGNCFELIYFQSHPLQLPFFLNRPLGNMDFMWMVTTISLAVGPKRRGTVGGRELVNRLKQTVFNIRKIRHGNIQNISVMFRMYVSSQWQSAQLKALYTKMTKVNLLHFFTDLFRKEMFLILRNKFRVRMCVTITFFKTQWKNNMQKNI